MRRLFKSKKALSPVVASIILIAVTVAVSIAVAAWMGALTFTFMKTEELKITTLAWTSTSSATLSLQNSGTSPLTISSVKVNDASATIAGAPVTMIAGAKGDYLVTLTTGTFSSGAKYEFVLSTATGNKYIYTGTCP